MRKASQTMAAGQNFPAAEWAARTSASAGSEEQAAGSARSPAEAAAACSATAEAASREAWKRWTKGHYARHQADSNKL